MLFLEKGASSGRHEETTAEWKISTSEGQSGPFLTKSLRCQHPSTMTLGMNELVEKLLEMLFLPFNQSIHAKCQGAPVLVPAVPAPRNSSFGVTLRVEGGASGQPNYGRGSGESFSYTYLHVAHVPCTVLNDTCMSMINMTQLQQYVQL